MKLKKCFVFMSFLVLSLIGAVSYGADLYVGRASADYTPDRPVYLQGQMHTRVSKGIDTPLLANILALESRENGKMVDSAIFVALDICSIQINLNEAIRNAVKKEIPEIDADSKLILSATHTHTSIATGDSYVSDRTDVMKGDEAAQYITKKVVPQIAAAWKNRVKAQFSYGVDFAKIAYNRRAVYNNGKAIMYGKTNDPKFRAIEGMEDHDVNTMFFWDMKNTLLAMIVNVSCPAQLVEGKSTVDADYWHPVREMIHAKYGKDVCVVGLCGAAGDMSPRPLYQKTAEARMRNLRKVNDLDELARRIVRAIDNTYPVVEKDKITNVPLTHKFVTFDVPQQKVSKELYEEFKAQAANYDKLRKEAKDKGASGPHVFYSWTNRVVKRYEAQKGVKNPTYPVSVHVLRIGPTAVCTNPYELYTDFGVQMKARSKAAQTFVVQLTDNRSIAGYVPSAGAASRGGYGAIPQSNHVGAEGGQVLTDKTLEIMNSLFK